jgi:hypothetical protein
MRKIFAPLLALFLIGCGSDADFVTSAPQNSPTTQTSHAFVGGFAGKDLGGSGKLELTVDAAGKISGTYTVTKAGVLPVGSHALSGQADTQTGRFSLSVVGSSEVLVGGELPVEGRHRSYFAQSSTARNNGLLVRQGLTDFPNNGQAEVRQWSLDVSRSNALQLADPFVDGGFFPNTGGEGLTLSFSDVQLGTPRLHAAVSIYSTHGPISLKTFYARGMNNPDGYYASYNDYRTGESWQSTEVSGGFVQVRKFDAESLFVEVNVKDLLAADPRSKGSIDFSGLVTVVPGR